MYKLLIADDELIEREAMRFIVKQNFDGQLEVFEAVNGKDLLEKVSKIKPNIVLTDIKMPGLNGIEAAMQIRQAFPDCRVILMSAFRYFNYAKDGLALGADDYITKPAPEEVIVAALNKAIQGIIEQESRKKKEEEINNKLKNVTQYLEEELIFLLSAGEIHEKSIEEFFEILGISSRNFTASAIKFLDDGLPDGIGGELQKRMLKKRLSDKLKEKLLIRAIQHLAGNDGQTILLLMMTNEDMDEYAANLRWSQTLTEIKDEILREMYISLNIGIGSQSQSIAKIYNSFLQAKIALKYDATAGSVISYGDISSKVTKTVEYPINKERQLLDAFIQGEKERSLQLLDELIDWMTMNLTGTDDIKQKMYQLLLVLIREADIELNIMELDTDPEDMRRNIFLLDNERECKTYAKVYLENKINDVINIKASRTSSLLSMMKEYINNNYDKDMSLESVADVIKVSPFYLSKLFKKETGSNFIDYLTDFRIRKAKELLSNPVNNVKEVCYMVGYKDPNYFARVFKKNCGVTPTEFREKR